MKNVENLLLGERDESIIPLSGVREKNRLQFSLPFCLFVNFDVFKGLKTR